MFENDRLTSYHSLSSESVASSADCESWVSVSSATTQCESNRLTHCYKWQDQYFDYFPSRADCQFQSIILKYLVSLKGQARLSLLWQLLFASCALELILQIRSQWGVLSPLDAWSREKVLWRKMFVLIFIHIYTFLWTILWIVVAIGSPLCILASLKHAYRQVSLISLSLANTKYSKVSKQCVLEGLLTFRGLLSAAYFLTIVLNQGLNTTFFKFLLN